MPWINRIVALLLMAGVIPLWRMADRFPGTGAAFPRVTLVAMFALAAVMLARSVMPARVRRVEAATRETRHESTALPLDRFRPQPLLQG